MVVVGFVAGLVAGGAGVWLLQRRSRTVPVGTAPLAPTVPESEVSQLMSASRQLMAELETRYAGRTADDGEPKRPTTKRRRRS